MTGTTQNDSLSETAPGDNKSLSAAQVNALVAARSEGVTAAPMSTSLNEIVATSQA